MKIGDTIYFPEEKLKQISNGVAAMHRNLEHVVERLTPCGSCSVREECPGKINNNCYGYSKPNEAGLIYIASVKNANIWKGARR